MKNILILFVSLILIGVSKPALPQAGSITMGLIATDCDQIIVEWNSTYSFVGAGQNQWVQATLTITWPETAQTDGNTLGTITSLLPGFTGWQYDGAAVLSGGTEWQRKVILLSSGYTQDIPIGITEIISIKLNGTGASTFTIADPFGISNISSFNFSGEMWSELFSPATTVSTSFADGIKWNGTRWCGGSSANYPGEPSSDDALVNCDITGAGGVLHESGAQVNNLTVNLGASLTIDVNATLTANKIITINGANGLNIASDASGTGSFISKTGSGTGFTYGSGASSTVEQYFSDNVNTVPFHVHFVGPLVNDPSYQSTNGHRGAYLSEFNLVGGSTYAYTYDNTLVGSEWVNVSDLTHLVPTTSGLALSTTTNAPQILSMTGQFIHGNITSANGPSVENVGWNLVANPWPSGLDLEAFLGTNVVNDGNESIQEDIYVWEGINDVDGGNYSVYTYGSGGTFGLTDGIIGIGQGFFVDFTDNANISFSNNAQRVHSNDILLKNEKSGLLKIRTSGNGFSDELIVHFREDAENSYGTGDAEKWLSMYENATQAWTVSSDNINLTINSLSANVNDLVSVPMSFSCSSDDNYMITASNMESFDDETEIWLEDLKLGGDWHNLVANPVYEFVGSSGDLQERFIIHFFGPTGIEDPMAEVSNVRIYSWGQDAYIVNRGNETIKEYVAYDMMGRELHRGTLPNSTVNKVQIGDVSAYYIVKVITREGTIYTDKVYITK
jgi:hypothetical protein